MLLQEKLLIKQSLVHQLWSFHTGTCSRGRPPTWYLCPLLLHRSAQWDGCWRLLCSSFISLTVQFYCAIVWVFPNHSVLILLAAQCQLCTRYAHSHQCREPIHVLQAVMCSGSLLTYEYLSLNCKINVKTPLQAAIKNSKKQKAVLSSVSNYTENKVDNFSVVHPAAAPLRIHSSQHDVGRTPTACLTASASTTDSVMEACCSDWTDSRGAHRPQGTSPSAWIIKQQRLTDTHLQMCIKNAIRDIEKVLLNVTFV